MLKKIHYYLCRKPKAEEWRINMCKAVEEIKRKAMNDGMEKGMEKGIEKGIERVVSAMFHNNIPAEKIAEMTGMPIKEIAKIEGKILRS